MVLRASDTKSREIMWMCRGFMEGREWYPMRKDEGRRQLEEQYLSTARSSKQGSRNTGKVEGGGGWGGGGGCGAG